MQKIVLTVQSAGNSKCEYRLGINISDSRTYFTKGVIIIIHIDELPDIQTKTACGSDEKGFDFYSDEITKWIKSNDFHIYPKRKPTKLEFCLEIVDDKFHLTFVKKLERN